MDRLVIHDFLIVTINKYVSPDQFSASALPLLQMCACNECLSISSYIRNLAIADKLGNVLVQYATV